jgi:nitrite reductase/ring-hydroxylating ferredoxin subunit
MFKKILFLSSLFMIFSCGNTPPPENCIRPVSLNIVRSFDNPDFNKILTIGSVEMNGGFKGILVINAGLDRFLAYDKICPNNDCNSPMLFDENNTIPILKCPCDDSEYGVGVGIGGAPQTEGFTCFAIEYQAVKVGTAIRISNF